MRAENRVAGLATFLAATIASNCNSARADEFWSNIHAAINKNLAGYTLEVDERHCNDSSCWPGIATRPVQLHKLLSLRGEVELKRNDFPTKPTRIELFEVGKDNCSDVKVEETLALELTTSTSRKVAFEKSDSSQVQFKIDLKLPIPVSDTQKGELSLGEMTTVTTAFKESSENSFSESLKVAQTQKYTIEPKTSLVNTIRRIFYDIDIEFKGTVVVTGELSPFPNRAQKTYISELNPDWSNGMRIDQILVGRLTTNMALTSVGQIFTRPLTGKDCQGKEGSHSFWRPLIPLR